jgi:hypothetical protein
MLGCGPKEIEMSQVQTAARILNADLIAQRDALLEGVETATRILREIAEESDGDFEDVEELEALIAQVKSLLPNEARMTCGPVALNARDSAAADAVRYRYLRTRDFDAISSGGVFAGKTPDNVVLNGDDLDKAIDDALKDELGAYGFAAAIAHATAQSKPVRTVIANPSNVYDD